MTWLPPARETRAQLVLWVSALTVVRLAMLWLAPAPVGPDEAQYWVYGEHLDWGFYSKPPLLPAFIALTTGVLGDTGAGIKFSMPLIHAAIALILGATAARLAGERAGFWTGLVYLTIPGVAFSSLIASTDPPMMLGWAIALHALVRLRGGAAALPFGALMGAGIGFGLLGKYTAIAFVAGLALAVLADPPTRRGLRPAALAAAAVALLVVIMPHLLWQAGQGFVSVRHVGENANLGGPLFNIGKGLEFTGAQFGVFGPLLFGALVLVIAGWRRYRAIEGVSLALAIAVPLLAVIITQSFLSRAHANWAAPAYLSASVAVVLWALATERRWVLAVSVALHLASGALIYGVAAGYAWMPQSLPQVADAARRFRGAEAVGAAVRARLDADPDLYLLADERKMTALLLYHADVPLERLAVWDPDSHPGNHFEMVVGLAAGDPRRFLLVSPFDVAPKAETFARFEPQAPITVQTHSDRTETVNVAVAEGFRGYGVP